MFGIVLADIAALNAAERSRYAEVYCGVCHSLKDRYGQMSRLCSNYDMAFAAVLLQSLFEKEEHICAGRCALKPTTDHLYVKGPFVDYAADMSVMLAYYKCIDDWIDDKSPTAFAATKALARAFARVEECYPELCKLTHERLQESSELEQQSLSLFHAGIDDETRVRLLMNADAIASAFGEIMAAVFAHNGGYWEEALRAFGKNVGRFVYFMDAAIDYDNDLHNVSYNPFVVCGTPKEEIDFLLRDEIGRATREFEKLPLEQDLHLMRSVLYSGVWAKLAAVEKKRERRETTII